MVEITRRRIHGNRDSADKAKSPTGAVAEREHRESVTMGCRTPNRIHTLILFGTLEDTHTYIPMVMTAMTTTGTDRYATKWRCAPHFTFFFRIASPFSLSPSIFSYRCHEADQGSRVTLVGLSANVLLMSAKGAAGWYMNSAPFLVDAGHSLSCKYALPTSCPFSKRCCATDVPLGGPCLPALSHAPRVQSHHNWRVNSLALTPDTYKKHRRHADVRVF
jgi:hypothetical protein